jgi:WS/DGAT/MGAT family acyltransferase
MIRRLSALDASFLVAETPSAHMHVGWAAVFDPPLDGAAPTFEALRDHMAARLGRAPRYRQRLAPVPFGVADPVWVDDERFDIEHHVLEAQAPSIDAVAAEAMSSPLEHARPLWECWVCPRLEDGRVGVVGKVHHCMVDGLAAVEFASLLLDATPSPPPEHDEWHPQPGPGALELLGRGLADRASKQLDVASLPMRLVASPGNVARAASQARKAWLALFNSFRRPARPVSPLNDEISPLRHLGRLARSLDEMRAIKSRFGTTVNDVVLAVCSGGMRRFLEDHGEPPLRLKAMVPASLRGSEEAGALGNRISFLFVELPIDEPDPVERLRAINRVTSARKAAGEPEGGETVLNFISYTPHLLQRALTRLIAHPSTFNLVVSNIPGPPEQLWMRGCALREVYPVVPLADRHALSIGVTSFQNQLFFGLYADRKLVPDTDRLAAHIDDEIDLLLRLSRPSFRPPRPRPHRSGRARGAGAAKPASARRRSAQRSPTV